MRDGKPGNNGHREKCGRNSIMLGSRYGRLHGTRTVFDPGILRNGNCANSQTIVDLKFFSDITIEDVFPNHGYENPSGTSGRSNRHPSAIRRREFLRRKRESTTLWDRNCDSHRSTEEIVRESFTWR